MRQSGPWQHKEGSRPLGRCGWFLLVSLWWGGCLAPLPVQAATPWFEGGRPSTLAQEALAVLADAPGHGLRSEDYGLATLQQVLAQAQRQAPEGQDAERIGRTMEVALRRYLGDLRDGRVDPRRLRLDYDPARRDPAELDRLLQGALAPGRLADAVRQAEPALPQYGQLRVALARYRALENHPAWQQALPPLPAPAQRGRPRTLEPGGRWPGLALLAQRLVATGDLAAADAAAWVSAGSAHVVSLPLQAASAAASAASAAAGSGSVTAAAYEGALLAAVQAFQTRHGLGSDGRLGRATWTALEVPPARRVQQLELTLERLRWTPLRRSPRMIVVNVPEFVLRAYEVRDDGQVQVRLTMKVIVGAALRTETPMLDDELRSIELNPYWNVPPSIARKELVPQLRRSPGVWDKEGYEFVTAGGTLSTGLSSALLDAVLAGQARIRQRPGPRNALGTLKFVFPNNESVYLHDTSAPGLFGRERRDFSHGCIRIEQPLALAQLVLQGQPEGEEAWLRETLAGGRNTHVRVARPWQVLITYATALVKEGRVHFFDDLYGHDRDLEAALRSRADTH